MKIIKNFNFLLLLSIANLVLFTSCDGDDDVSGPTLLDTDIISTAQLNPNLSSFVAAVEAAGLTTTLAEDSLLTVFAPTNSAFQNLLNSNPDWNSIEDIPVDVLTTVLLFHVLDSEVYSNSFTNTYLSTLSPGPESTFASLQVSVEDNVKLNGSAKPVFTDVTATNGVIHIIDKVMLPPTIVDIALNNDNFSSLVAALTDSRHTTDYITLLNSDGPFTVFAPTNDAFQDLLDSQEDWNSIADIPIEVLEQVLNYHVVEAVNLPSSDLSNGLEITMLSGQPVTVDLIEGVYLQTTSGQQVAILAVDVQGTNGIVHAIDEVMIP